MRKNENGFTMIEVLIAIAIFAIGMMAVARMQLWAVRNTTSGNVLTQATMLGQARMEALKNVTDVTTLDPLDGTVEANLTPDELPGGIFRRTTRITNPLLGSFSRQIEIEIQWTRMGQTRNVVLTSVTQGSGI